MAFSIWGCALFEEAETLKLFTLKIKKQKKKFVKLRRFFMVILLYILTEAHAHTDIHVSKFNRNIINTMSKGKKKNYTYFICW